MRVVRPGATLIDGKGVAIASLFDDGYRCVVDRARGELLAGPGADLSDLERLLDDEAFSSTESDRADLRGADFRDSDLTRAKLRWALLSEADFRGATLERASFAFASANGAKFTLTAAEKASFVGAELEQASFQLADLHGSHFADADLTGANFAHANLGGADLSRANLHRAYLIGAELGAANLPTISHAFERRAPCGRALSPNEATGFEHEAQQRCA